MFAGLLSKTNKILKTNVFAVNHSRVDWEKLKADLEGLSKHQVDLVLRLIEQMKTYNESQGKAQLVEINRSKYDS